MIDFYELLSIRPDATSEEVRRAYRDLAQKAMWDRPRFSALSEAFDTLKDPNKREEYDRQWRAAHGIAEPRIPQNGSGLQGEEDSVVYSTAASGPGAGRTQTMVLPPCPVCSTPAPPGEEFCPECGFLLGSTPGPAAPERPLPRLREGSGREWALKTGENVIGREGADVSLGDRTVSRRHARVVVEADGDLWMEDLGSTNGTQRAERTLPPGQRAALADGTQIQFGAVKVTVILPDAPLALPLPEAPTAAAPREVMGALPAPAAPAAPEEAEAEEPVAKLVGANGQVYALTETTTTFGRRSTNHFVLNGDPYVSGAHAQVLFDGKRFQVLDMGSTNGTQVNGQRLIAHAPHPIDDGDHVVMGRTALRFHTRVGGPPPEPDEEPTP